MRRRLCIAWGFGGVTLAWWWPQIKRMRTGSDFVVMFGLEDRPGEWSA